MPTRQTQARPGRAKPSKSASEPTWDVVYVLPNLAPTRDPWSTNEDANHANLFWRGVTLDSESVAITSKYDSRVKGAAARDKKVRRLLSSFVDTNGKKLHPSVLIVRENSQFVGELEGIVAYRNCVALSVVLKARAAWVRGHSHATGWSDYFDFHPLQVGARGLLSVSPSQLAILTENAKYQAMPSPNISATTVRTLFTDRFLRYTLAAEWRRYYEEPTRRTKRGRALFRSLEIAYIAGATPDKHGGTVYEWGVQMALWVSAIEVLVSAALKDSSKWLTLDLLGEYNWGDYRPALQKQSQTVEFTVNGEKVQRSVNLIQHSAYLLYKARNKFLHGNTVTDEDLWPWGREKRPDGEDASSISIVAPLVYRIALHAFLSREYKPKWETLSDKEADRLAMESVMAEYDYAEALKAIYGVFEERRGGVANISEQDELEEASAKDQPE